MNKDSNLKAWAFHRPYCKPAAGIITAKTSGEAIRLIHFAYGFASRTEVYCAETNERFKDNT